MIPVDALALARRHGLGRIVNSALLGAFARVIEAPPLEVLGRTIVEQSPKQPQQNLAACEDGYRWADAQLQRSAA